MFVDELGLLIPCERNSELVEVGDIALKLDAADEEHRHRNALLLNVAQERVLKAAGALVGHDHPRSVTGHRPGTAPHITLCRPHDEVIIGGSCLGYSCSARAVRIFSLTYINTHRRLRHATTSAITYAKKNDPLFCGYDETDLGCSPLSEQLNPDEVSHECVVKLSLVR